MLFSPSHFMKDEDRKVFLENKISKVLNLQSSEQILRNLQTEWLKTTEPKQKNFGPQPR